MRSNNSSSGRKGRGGSSPKRNDGKPSLDWRRKEAPSKSDDNKSDDSKSKKRGEYTLCGY
jgi:hypothetical protein